MSTPLPPSVGTGFSSSPNSPEYIDLNVKDLSQERVNTRLQQGGIVNQQGAILTKDSLDVPLEVAFGITNDRTNSSRPSLLPLFRTRYVDDRHVEDLTHDYYQELKSSLPEELRTKLEMDEAKFAEDRDPELMALNHSLRFEANLLALADSLSIPLPHDEKTLLAAEQFEAMPGLVRQELLSYGTAVANFLDDHLASIGPNDPSYDILLNVSNQIKEAIILFK